MTLGSDLEADKDYTLHVEVTDHALNKKNNWDDASQPYRFYISGELTTPSIAFDNDTKTGKYLDFTKKTEKLGFIVSNVKTVEDQSLPTVQVEIKSLQEEGDSENITARQREDKKWEAFTENTPFSKGKYQATVTVTDFKNAKASSIFDFHVKPSIQPTKIELVDESKDNKSFVTTNASALTLTYDTPKFNIKFDKEDIHSVNIELKDSDDNVIENKQLTQKEMTEGEYSYEPDTLANQKDYILTVTATDKAGNQSPKGQDFNINTNQLKKVDIELDDKDKTGDKKSNFTKNKKPTLILKTQEDNINKIELFKKVEDGDGDGDLIDTLISSGGFKKNKDETWQIPENIFNKDGKYTIIAQPYKGKKQGPKTEIEIDFYQNAPDVKDIQLNAASKSTFDESGIYTNEPTPGFLITVPDGDEHRVWKMQVLVIKQSTENPLETINITENIFPANRPNSVNTQKPWSKGTYDIVVTLTDKADNKSKQKTQTIHFDDTKPEPVIAFAPEVSPEKSGEKNIIKNQNRKFVIKGTEEKGIEESDEIEVTLTQSNKNSSKETLYNSKKNQKLFRYDKDKTEQTFSLFSEEALDKGDFKLNVKVTDRYGNTGNSQEPLSFTIQDSVEKPKISLIDDDDTSYDKQSDVYITNKREPRFKLSDLDEHATKVEIKTTIPVVGATQLNDTFDDLATNNTKKEELKNSFQLKKSWTTNGDYKLSVNTFVDEEPSPETTLTVIFDDQLNPPQIALDEETRKSSSKSHTGAIVASQTPRFNLSDIDPDVKKVSLKVYQGDNTKPIETIEFDIKSFEETSTREDIERKGIKATNNRGYTYQPLEWEDKTKYKITLTVTDRAKNSNEKNPAEFEVNIDTAIAKIPSITLNETDNQASDKIKKFITKNQTPSFQLDNIDDRAKTITITIYKPGSTTDILASHTFPKETRTFNVNQLILADTDKSELSSLADGQYTIQAAVTLKTNIPSSSGTLFFTVDHAEAPTHTIELVGNTGTNDKPVTNKTSPKFNIEGIALDRLDWDNPDSIVVTFKKKNSEDQAVIQNLTKSDIQENNTVEFTANQLEQGEYTVTANVTYQAGQVGSGRLNDGMTIYTQAPQSMIEFENPEKVLHDGDKNKVQKQDLKFKILVTENEPMLQKGSSQVKVSLKKGGKTQGSEIETQYNSNVWKVDLLDKSIPKGDYTIEANVTDTHGNTGKSEPMNFYMLDGLLKPEIEIDTNDHTPYDPTEYKDNKKITHNTQPTTHNPQPTTHNPHSL
ncbi:hypothetical protein GWK90_00710 [Candidatus Hamiltonella defensa]|nr:Ig-like domain-containing protein [Candidatus Hamiltonella defensa]MBK4360819.1 hypothetical protein [Candidatus Hamiltonella defensa]